jgi:hypothetical protein
MRKSQIAIEFVIFMGAGLVFLIGFVIAITALGADKVDEKAYYKLNDFGASIQSEIILASEVNEGYTRTIFIPRSVEGIPFTMNNTNSHLFVHYKKEQLHYAIPNTLGMLQQGYNTLRNNNGTVVIT